MSLSAQVSFVLVAYNEPWRADQLCQLVRELRPGMRVQPAADGHAALELCKRQVPSLLIIDGELEGLDGRQLLRELRRHGPTQRLPCVLISARTDTASVRTVLPLAPAAYLGKPYDLDDLRQRLDRLLPRSAGRAGVTTPAVADTVESFLERMRPHNRGAPLQEAVLVALQRLQGGDQDFAELEELLTRDPQVTARLISVASNGAAQPAAPCLGLAQARRQLGAARSLQLVTELALQHNARLPEPRLAELAGQLGHQALRTARLASWLARQLKLDVELCFSAGLLQNIGELALLRSLQEWLDSGGALDEADLQRCLRERAAGFGSALRAQWALPLELRQVISAYYALGAGVLRREALVLNLTRLLIELPADAEPASLAGERTVRLLRIDPDLLARAPRHAVAG
ncbi:HDOD domain-containing protein [Stutzerimonas frequens]|uniref:HDOD domain-containing protein n=1 Tax=Stutzerimonas frequens TaxID=2968969 RepID=UPI0007B79ECF|nr:HDOD domain-containing protein [Stutzerimonas frequens]MAL92707.1 response regulator [Pseudomonas sp.]MEC7472973.1 HDOD domain-containing protein [Pseudomonadota bacterium]NCT79577.1 HDOD domain-containing protein [Stutzerimonas stutzeri]AWT12079.1 response regulator [Stutzerimonas frequens]KZX57654.1 histidine kinase [Stutzerimonas frequens]